MQQSWFSGSGLFVLQAPNKSPCEIQTQHCDKGGATEMNRNSQQMWLQQY